ncbi:hypothetical protein C7S20_14940 [Christiangramia fulva]|uniref:Hydrolase n=1 Tax=Christiangramia fulva TaxID=2126553 RepID=A0A2R3Z896_9FLAO|nr:hypothetical protein [Christiangramia fulva]AVR46455.1 hypothetical protein C7S20_14940 [Christiangramia fulva]
MRKRILIYLFIFALLSILFIYVNDKRILSDKDEKITALENDLEAAKKENDSLLAIESNDYFNLSNNEEAISYFEKRRIDTKNLISKIEDAIISQNKAHEDNPLIPYAGMEGNMRINRIKILNHKWIIADFTDGTYWGEVFLSYEVGEDGKLNFTAEKSFLYPRG